MISFLILTGLIAAGWVVWRLVFGIMSVRKVFSSDKISDRFFQSGFWKDLRQNTELRRRIAVTIGAVVIYKILALVPLPGINAGAVMQLLERVRSFLMMTAPSGAVLDDVSIFGPFYQRFSLLSFGLIPYLVACLVVQIAAALIPPVKKKIFRSSGRTMLVKITAVVAVVVCAVQAFFHTLAMEKTMFDDVLVVAHPGWMFRILAVISLVSAFSLALWLARMITEKGIGAGLGILVGVDVVIRVMSFFKTVFLNMVSNHLMGMFYGSIVMTAVMMAAVCFLTLWRRNLNVEIGSAKEKIPLRLSRLANIPAGISFLIMAIPVGLAFIFPQSIWQGMAAALSEGHVLYFSILVFLMGLMTYIYTAILISPELDTKMIRKYQGRLDGREKELEIENRFYAEFERLTLWIAGIIIIFTLSPRLPDILGMRNAFFLLFGFGGFFIIFGVVSDTMENLKVKMERAAKRYDFLCLTATDEIEVCVKKCLLESHGIGCVIEPFRFTWGLPVKTAGDEYRLYVEQSCAQRAGELLKD